MDVDKENLKIDDFVGSHNRKTVVVQGLGYVGAAVVAALASAKDNKQNLIYNVIGVDLPDENNYWKIDRVNNAKPPVVSSDTNLEIIYQNALENENLMATYSEYAYSKADIVVVDINLHVEKKEISKPDRYIINHDVYKKAIETIAEHVNEDTLVIIETTVPPGTTEKVIYPIFADSFAKRGLDINRLYLGHSYERVMPGTHYIDSIVNFYRVYSGINDKSKLKTREFLESFINTKDYPLFEMQSTTASEIAKVLENSYRAMNIAFIQEWTEFAQKAGINLFEAIDAIRARPTHQNIMSPGFGVGGYCLTKDALLADYSYRNLFCSGNHLKMSLDAIAVNDLMPNYTFELLKKEINDLRGINITILGISYRDDIADTRRSPSELFYERCLKEGAVINLHDEYVSFWAEKGMAIDTDIDKLKEKKHDAVVFAVRHKRYTKFTSKDIMSIFKDVKVIVDANNVISDETARGLSGRGIKVIGVGKGHWQKFARSR